MAIWPGPATIIKSLRDRGAALCSNGLDLDQTSVDCIGFAHSGPAIEPGQGVGAMASVDTVFLGVIPSTFRRGYNAGHDARGDLQ